MICRNHIDVSQGVRRCCRCGGTFCGDCLVDISGQPYCATCKTEQLLDVRSGVDMGVLDYASIGRRFAAQFIDGLVIYMPVMLVIFVMAAVSGSRNPAATNLWILPAYAVYIIYEASMLKAKGQTLGKMAMKVKVVRVDGTDVSGGQAWGRALARVLLGLLYIIDYIPAFFTADKKTLHDMAAGTRVVNWA
jgi:uncharacterized RDD family membrane protein YckC